MDYNELNTSVTSAEIAQFGGDDPPNSVKQINYNVPLPSGHPVNRIVALEIESGWFTEQSSNVGSSLVDLGIIQANPEGGVTGINNERLTQLYRRALPANAKPSLRAVTRLGGQALPLLEDFQNALAGNGANQALPLTTREGTADLLDRRRVVAEPDDVEVERRRKATYIDRLAPETAVVGLTGGEATIIMPMSGLGTSIREVPVNPAISAVPRLALVETWELRSRLGAYGLGRTLNTFSLLPGERTTITVQTWRTDSATREDATSIFDSSDTAAQTRFTAGLSIESGSAFQDQSAWALSLGASHAGSMTWGIFSGSHTLEAGYTANHQETSQHWSNSIVQTAGEHANQVNNSRRQSVQSCSTTTTDSGTVTTTVREISNTNLRRVLNFVYRELNQEHRIDVLLRDIRVAFYNGRVGSAEIVPLGDLRSLIRRRIRPENQEAVARYVLGLCVERTDYRGQPVVVLQSGSRPDGIHYQWRNAALSPDGTLSYVGDPLSTEVRWRFAPGALSDVRPAANGLVTSRSEVVLRTDSVVVEALMGRADALDPYAAALQALDLRSREADIAWRQADIRRTTDALDLVARARSNASKIAAWTQLFPQVPDIQVVPVAAVNNNNNQ